MQLVGEAALLRVVVDERDALEVAGLVDQVERAPVGERRHDEVRRRARSVCSWSRDDTSSSPASARKRCRRSAVLASVTSSMMLTASVPPSSSSVALVSSQYSRPVLRSTLRVSSVGASSPGQQPLPRQVGLLHRRAVLARDDEARRQLAGLGGEQLLDRLRARAASPPRRWRRRACRGSSWTVTASASTPRMRSSRCRVRRSSEISCVLANPRAARSASACRNGSCSSGAERAGERPRPRLPSSWSETCSGRLTQCARSMVLSQRASSSSWAIARSDCGVDGDDPRLAGAQRRHGELGLLARRPPGRQVGGELRPAGSLVVRGEPLRLAGLVDDVERAGVGDARHDQRDELVGALAGPARAVGDPLDLEQELEAVVALADPERGAGDTRACRTRAAPRCPGRDGASRMSQRVAIEAIIVRPRPRPGLSGCGVIPRPSSSTRTSTQPSPASAVSATRPRSRPTNAWMIALVTASETASVMLLIASSDAPWARANSATPRRSSPTTAGSASTSRCQRGGGGGDHRR